MRRYRVQLLLGAVGEQMSIGPEIESRAEDLEMQGIHAFDALHLAAAESAGVDIFLTTDDRLLRVAKRLSDSGQLAMPVANPLSWLQENST
ncbi:MAG: hypothetical protein JWN98_931 [Abditibacteriota bacterium]|nr:hypothetical protein [Abditibacteriota bacterium]